MCGVSNRRARLRKMATFSLSGFALALLLGAAEAKKIEASIFDPTTLIDHGSARPIKGWVDFCTRVPRECDSSPDEPTAIRLTDEVWKLIVSTNRQVNTAIKPLTDQMHWGVTDRWDLPEDGFGDCEDYQLLKRKLLVEKGLPRRAMRMTVVLDDRSDGHAVLTIRTDRGDFAHSPWILTTIVVVELARIVRTKRFNESSHGTDALLRR